MRNIEPIRQTIAARQIEEALKKRGLSKKQFADLMGRNPSEVTKWLSGRHNFTIALLQEISDALGSCITGVDDIGVLVDGYESRQKGLSLNDYQTIYGCDTALYTKIRKRSADLGMGPHQYITMLVEKDILEEGLFPKVDLSQIDDEVVERYAGIIKVFPTQQDLDNDERLAMIWKR